MNKVNFPHEGKLLAKTGFARNLKFADGILKSTIKHNEWCLIAINVFYSLLLSLKFKAGKLGIENHPHVILMALYYMYLTVLYAWKCTKIQNFTVSG